MFETGPILFLQSLASPWLTLAMTWVSMMGGVPFYVAVVGTVVFCLDLRRGFVLAQLLLSANLLTDVAKWTFALPRPVDVDAAVIDPRTGAANATRWRGRGAPSFLAPIDGDVLASLRPRPAQSYGFPSGHVGTTVALWGGLAVLFRRRGLVGATAVAVPLMALSRMYLGRHFLADVLGGAALGGALVALAALAATGPGPAPLASLRRLADLRPSRRHWTVLVLVAPAAALACSGIVDRQRAGQLLGLGAAYLILALGGIPEEAPGWPRALARCGLALALGGAPALAAGWLSPGALPPAAAAAARVASGALPAFLLLWGTVTLGRLLALYREPACERTPA